MNTFDFSALSPIERIELADLLYDSAMQQIDAAKLPPERLVELDRRIAEVHSASVRLLPWEKVGPMTLP